MRKSTRKRSGHAFCRSQISFDPLDRHFPGLSGQYREKYGDAYEVVSDESDRLMHLFHEACEKRGILHTPDACFRYTSELPEKYPQMTLFDL